MFERTMTSKEQLADVLKRLPGMKCQCRSPQSWSDEQLCKFIDQMMGDQRDLIQVIESIPAMLEQARLGAVNESCKGIVNLIGDYTHHCPGCKSVAQVKREAFLEAAKLMDQHCLTTMSREIRKLAEEVKG